MSYTNPQTQTAAVKPNYRLDGIYQQRQKDFFLQRVKLAAGVLSSEQTRTIASAAARFGQGMVHLTTRGSMEIHWLHETDLPAVKRALAAVGLTSRGACGGAVRGVSCASQGALGFPAVERLAHRIHRYFTGNPRFERLPKKFKIAVEADLSSKRHLIQDAGIVLSSEVDGIAYFDIYVAGGLGREPQPGFLLESSVSEARIIPLLEGIVRVYTAHTPSGKRLKHLIRQIGEDEFLRLLAAEPSANEELPPVNSLCESFLLPANGGRVVVKIEAGQIDSKKLTILANFADSFSGGYMAVTVDQDIAFNLTTDTTCEKVQQELGKNQFSADGVNFRVCPGNATCPAGLSSTREVAKKITDVMKLSAKNMTWAISGCPNSCTQPQLADVGIVTSSFVKGSDGEIIPIFDLYKRGNADFATAIEKGISLEELYNKIQEIS